MSVAQTCPKCGAAIPGDTPHGSCPTCVLAGMISPPRVRYFGDYELLGEIARGGMGVVYRARQVSLNRPVALKMILAANLVGEDAIKRLRHEAESVARLDHPNIVPIHEVGEHESQHYFSMKLVEGGSLADALSERISNLKSPISNADTAKLMSAIARAIHYAHQRGILHRDLKPSNILLDTHGQPHITDFGLAKFVVPPSGGPAPSEPAKAGTTSDLTLTGQVLGTPNYMSPEQAAGDGRQLTTATDVYSLGAVLYFLLTGQPPFHADTPLATLRKVLDEEPVPPRLLSRSSRRKEAHFKFGDRPLEVGMDQSLLTSAATKIDRDLETITLKCLEKEPSRRYASAEALAEDLENWLAGRPIQARPVSPWERSWKWVRRHPVTTALSAAVIVSSLVGLGGILWQWRRAESANHQLVHQVATDALRSAHADQATGHSPASVMRSLRALRHAPNHPSLRGWLHTRLSSDSFLVLQREWPHPGEDATVLPGRPHPRGKSPSEAEVQLLEKALGTTTPIRRASVSPDGTRAAASTADGKVHLFTLRPAEMEFGLPAATLVTNASLAHPGPIQSIAFTASGRRLVTITDDGVVRLLAATTEAPLRFLAAAPHPHFVLDAVFDEDTEQLWTTSSDHHARVFRLTPPPTNTVTLLPGIAAAVPLPAEHALLALTSPGDLLRVRWTENLITVPTQAVIAASTALALAGNPASAAYIGDATGQVFQVALAPGSLPRHIYSLPRPRKIESLAASPDGRWLAIADSRSLSLVEVQSGSATFTAPARGSPDPQQPRSAVAASKPSASPPERHAAAQKNRAPSIGPAVLLTNLPMHDIRSLAMSPRGEWFAAGCYDGSVFLLDAAQSQARWTNTTHHGPVYGLAFSPDGQRLATSSMDQTARIWDVRSGREVCPPLKHRAEAVSAAFSRDGKRLATGGNYEVRAWDVATGREIPGFPPREHHDGLRRFSATVEFSPDDSRLLASDNLGHATVWDVSVGCELNEWNLSMPGRVSTRSRAAWLDDNLAVAWSFSGVVRFVEFPPAPRTELLRDLAEWLTNQAVNADGAVLWLDEPARAARLARLKTAADRRELPPALARHLPTTP
jgi:serine/threonine protein kinase/WD40 repeat protein